MGKTLPKVQPARTEPLDLLLLLSAPIAGLGCDGDLVVFEHCSDFIHAEFVRQRDALSEIPSRKDKPGLCHGILQISVGLMQGSQYCKNQQISCLEDFWFKSLSFTFSFSSYSQKIFQAHSILCLLTCSCDSSSCFTQDG